MRLMIQRVKEAQVTIQGAVHSRIGPGLLVFLGIHKNDSAEVIGWLVNKLVNLRIFGDEQDKMNLSVKDIKGEILVVSQFTLYGNCQNGRRPDFIESAPPSIAEALYDTFVGEIKKEMGKVGTGQFREYMQVSLINDGPVTFMIEK